MSFGDQKLDNLVESYLGEKIKRINLLNQNGANLVYLHGQSVGKELGLSPDVLNNITPFPASTVLVNEGGNEQQRSTEVGGEATRRRFLPYALTALLGLGLGGGGYATYQSLQDEEKPPVVEQADTVPGAASINPNVDFTVE